jgi:hypothetical protein
MIKKVLLVVFFCVQLECSKADVYLPVEDGTVYPSNGADTDAYISLSGTHLEGDLQFASFNALSYSSIQLELTMYAWPYTGTSILVYGYDNASGQLSSSDFNAGTYLGTWTIPSNLGSQPVYFDVTSFVQSETGSYFGFDLQSSGFDTFGSTAYNYGVPPELIATGIIPEPSSMLIALAIGSVGIIIRYCGRRLRAQ